MANDKGTSSQKLRKSVKAELEDIFPELEAYELEELTELNLIGDTESKAEAIEAFWNARS